MIRMAVALAVGLVLGGSTASTASDGITVPPAIAAQPSTQPTIQAGPEVLALIGRVQDALGGRKRLLAVRSVLIEGQRVLASGEAAPYTYRVLLPDRYQDVRGKLTFTLDGAAFWQIPPRDETLAQSARKNTTSWFGELCVVLLLRAPTQIPVKAELVKCDAPGRQCIAFTGTENFNRTLEIDAKTFLPAGFIQQGQGTQNGVQTAMTRRVVIEEFREVGGIKFPVRMTETFADSSSKVEYLSIRVNEGVAATDFKQR